MTKYGIQIAARGGNIKTDGSSFTTEYPVLGVNLSDYSPPHFDLVNVTVTSSLSLAPTAFAEVMLQIRHNMPFIPLIDAFFFPGAIKGTDIGISQQGFYKNYWLYGLGIGYECLVTSVDESFLTVTHVGQNDFGPVASLATDVPIFMKYYIYNIPGSKRDGTKDVLAIG